MPRTPATPTARQRLLSAASELFYESGIAATGVDAVLARAGVSPATMYAHFAGKDALVAAYLEERHHRWRGVWDEVLAESGDHRDRLLSVFDALTRYRRRTGDRRGCGFQAAATELPAGHPGQTWLAADTALLSGRLLELARAAGADRPGELAADLLLLYDGALAGLARRAAAPAGFDQDPLGRARVTAQLLLATRLPDAGSAPRRPPA
ncbi:TetR/AcrR family transcriptional regulator [Blastococcus sp. MG754426]|uniref:TetR/AcrR family transcriptional regulator n=1 Tax=unclassified Blastococcus TaxID=2619396 RepID=UPI001EF0A721|nr:MULTISPECIES: TetR/AcrR family transcriptional regulator [unclassified Blastococcus]MCF6508544.1 TetR/AcrR family transcriptional regulator [Blastococcus sp. MG754426]MCF6510735.1 TetR/AcrR family transcriptional regulator [Blastococcus sp. MG754427]